MKFPLSVWVALLSCCVQEANGRRAHVRILLDAHDTEAQVSDHSPIDTPTKIHNANEAEAQDVELKINTTPTVSQSHAQLASNVNAFTRPPQQQSNPTALLEGRHSDVGKHEKVSSDRHDEEQLNSATLLQDRGSSVGKPKPKRKDVHVKESNTTVSSEAVIVKTIVKKGERLDFEGEFDDGVPKESDFEGEFDDGVFFEIFGPVFQRNAKWSGSRPVPALGDADTSYAKVKAFYDFWFAFESRRDLDTKIMEEESEGEDCFHDIDDADDREDRRWMERENAKVRRKYEKAERQRIFGFVELAEKHDPRVIAEKEKHRAVKEAVKAAKGAKWLETERIAREKEERRVAAEEEARAAKASEKKGKEEHKHAAKKARAKLRKSVQSLNLGFAEDPLQEFLLMLDPQETDELTQKLAGEGIGGEIVLEAMKAKGVEAVYAKDVDQDEKSAEGDSASEERPRNAILGGPSNVEKDQGKHHKEQLSRQFSSGHHSDAGKPARQASGSKLARQASGTKSTVPTSSKSKFKFKGRKASKPEKESEEMHGDADVHPALWIAGGLCLLSCCGYCLFARFIKKDIVSQKKMIVSGNSMFSSLSLNIDDRDGTQLSFHSALAQPFVNQCLLQTAQLWTGQGAVDVGDLQAESELIDTEGDVVRVKSICPKPNWERDFVEVELEEGEFEVTSSHLLEASTNGNVWYPWLAGDLRAELFVRTDAGPRQIIEIHKKPRRPVTVIQVELERNATVWLNASGVWVSIFGAQVEEFIEQVHNLVYLKPPCGLYSLIPKALRSSASEPDITHSCGGACHHWKNLGKCKYGQDCVDCHVFGCTKAKTKMGKRQRKRVSRAFSDDPDSHRDSCEK